MKRLVICFDGTWNTADSAGRVTNVVRLARMILPRDAAGVVQMVFYDPGVGTGNKVDKYIGGVAGNGLESHVKAGYLFLAQNYEPGDEIYIFGFSRGAFTARSLCGFVGACRGLLERAEQHNIADAWDFYRTPPIERDTVAFHSDIVTNVRTGIKVKVLGVWDTVGSLGIPTDILNFYNRQRYAFHDTSLSAIAEHAFQALAIDEHRGPFEATLWDRPSKPIPGQIVEQVWFPGVHADIGGGYPNSECADLSLRWMIARTVLHSPLAIDRASLAYFTPELADDADFARGMTRPQALQRIVDKASGPINNSLGFYVFSRLNPRMRVIGGAKPRMGTGPHKKVFRLPSSVSKKIIGEAIHWSAQLRRESGRKSGQPYDPPNLRVALDDLETLTMAQEVLPGKSWDQPVAPAVAPTTSATD